MPAKTNQRVTPSSPQPTARDELPANWPDDITFLDDLTYSQMVTLEQRVALSRPAPESDPWTKITKKQIESTREIVRITTIDDEKHPAHKQRGLSAVSKLEPDTFIALYLGHVHTNSLSDTDPHSDYDLSLDRDIGLSVDAARSGNHARFANDYRGIAERPNAEFRDCFVQVPCLKRAGGLKWERRVGIFVLSAGKAGKRKNGIRSGEEILVSYGKSFWESRKIMATFRKDFDMLKIADAALEL